MLGPGENLVEGLAAAIELGVIGQASQAGHAQVEDGLGRHGPPRQRQCRCFEEVAEDLLVAGHDRVQGLADLATQHTGFVDEVAAMAAQQLDAAVQIGPYRFEQSEALSGGSEDAAQVGVVGLVVGIGGLAILFAGEGMHETRFRLGLPQVASGAGGNAHPTDHFCSSNSST